MALLARFDVLLMRAAMGMFATLFSGFRRPLRIVFETAAAMLAAFTLAGVTGPSFLFSHD
jgi:hypothetical protein